MSDRHASTLSLLLVLSLEPTVCLFLDDPRTPLDSVLGPKVHARWHMRMFCQCCIHVAVQAHQMLTLRHSPVFGLVPMHKLPFQVRVSCCCVLPVFFHPFAHFFLRQRRSGFSVSHLICFSLCHSPSVTSSNDEEDLSTNAHLGRFPVSSLCSRSSLPLLYPPLRAEKPQCLLLTF